MSEGILPERRKQKLRQIKRGEESFRKLSLCVLCGDYREALWHLAQIEGVVNKVRFSIEGEQL